MIRNNLRPVSPSMGGLRSHNGFPRQSGVEAQRGQTGNVEWFVNSCDSIGRLADVKVDKGGREAEVDEAPRPRGNDR